MCRSLPKCSMYGIFAYMSPKFMVNVGKYSIHGAFGLWCVLAPAWWIADCIESNLNLTSHWMAKIIPSRWRGEGRRPPGQVYWETAFAKMSFFGGWAVKTKLPGILKKPCLTFLCWQLPYRERIHIPPGEKENHQKCRLAAGSGYVSSKEGS